MILDWRPSNNLANHLGTFFLGLAVATLCHGIFTDDMAPREIAWGTSFLLLGLISFAFGFLLRHRQECLAPWGLSSFGNGKAWFSPSHPEDSNENADSRKLLPALMAADMNLLEFDLSTGRTITPAEFFEPLGFSKGWKPPSLHDAIKVLVHPDDRALFRARVESLRRGKREHFRMEGRVVLGRGERLWCQCDAVAATDPETRERRLLFFLQDITERIDAREQLEASRTRYESLVEDMPLLQCMSDSDGKLTFVNHAFAEYFGRRADALVGKNFSELIPASWADYVRSETEQITLQEPIRVIEHPVKHPDGSLRKVRWTVRAFFDEMDRRIRLQRLGEDITELMEMEDRLLRSRQRLKLAVESGEVGLWEWDLIHDMVTFNDVARMMLGVGEGDLHETLDCVIADLLHPDDARGVFANAQAYLQGTIDHYECTFRLKHRDGSWRWVLSRGRVTERTAEGKPIRMAGTHSDITNLIQVQEELEAIRGKAVTAGKEMQRQRDMLNALIHSAPEGLLFKDIEGTILQCNPVVCRMLGKDPDELLHRKCSDIFPGNRGRGYEEDDQRVLRERKTLRKREALRDHQGRRIIVDKIKSPCFDQRGELLGSLTIAHDITESFRSEALNRASGLLLSRRHDYEKSLSQVLSLIGEATSVDRIRLFRVQRIPGSHRYRAHFLSQFDTTAPNEPVPVVDDSFPLPAISAPLRLGKIAMYQGELFEAAFAEHFPGLPTHSLAAVPIFVGKRFWGFLTFEETRFAYHWQKDELDYLESVASHLAVVVENSESYQKLRRAREDAVALAHRADAANMAKTQFLANMSHEIRTPMTAILGYSDILSNAVEDPEIRDAVETVGRNGKYLLELVNNILDLSRIESGKIEVENTRFSPTELVRNIVSLMKMRAGEKDIALCQMPTPVVPEAIETDATRLQQVLLNLVGNAIKFTNKGNVTIHWGCYLAEAEDSRPVEAPMTVENEKIELVFEVRDTGIGIPEDRLAKIFEPFVQADVSTTRRFGGSGLGLSICRKLIQMLGGTIEATSRENAGSSFTIRWKLPAGTRLLPHDSPTLGKRSAETKPGTAAGKEAFPKLAGRVLLVEDGPDNQRLISFLLKKAGADVIVADDGQKGLLAVEKARQEGQPFDLILMDMQMPVLDGYEATRALREKNDDTPVIALTAHAMSGDAKKCLEAGCNGFLAKPFQQKDLLDVVARTIPSKKSKTTTSSNASPQG